METKIEPLLLTLEEAAQALHMSRSKIYRVIAAGRLMARQDQGRRFVERTEIDRYIRELPLVESPKEG